MESPQDTSSNAPDKALKDYLDAEIKHYADLKEFMQNKGLQNEKDAYKKAYYEDDPTFSLYTRDDDLRYFLKIQSPVYGQDRFNSGFLSAGLENTRTSFVEPNTNIRCVHQILTPNPSDLWQARPFGKHGGNDLDTSLCTNRELMSGKCGSAGDASLPGWIKLSETNPVGSLAGASQSGFRLEARCTANPTAGLAEPESAPQVSGPPNLKEELIQQWKNLGNAVTDLAGRFTAGIDQWARDPGKPFSDAYAGFKKSINSFVGLNSKNTPTDWEKKWPTGNALGDNAPCKAELIAYIKARDAGLLAKNEKLAELTKCDSASREEMIKSTAEAVKKQMKARTEARLKSRQETHDKLEALEAKMTADRDKFNAEFDERSEKLLSAVENDIQRLKTPFPAKTIEMVAGKGTVSGQLLKPAGFVLHMQQAAYDVSDMQKWGENDQKAKARSPRLQDDTSIGQMLINDCYRRTSFINNPADRGLEALVASGSAVGSDTNPFLDDPNASAEGNSAGGIHMYDIIDPRFLKKNKNFLYDPNTLEMSHLDDDKSCGISDTFLNQCGNILDGAQYIGVTFDIRFGYNLDGYRNQIVKMWCADQNKAQTWGTHRSDIGRGEFDIPDFMFVRGEYQTFLSTKGYRRVEEYQSHLAKVANIKDGNTAFAQEMTKFSGKTATDDGVGIDANGGYPAVIGISTSHKRSDTYGRSDQNLQFANARETELEDYVKEKREKRLKETETMLSVMDIKLTMYRAHLDYTTLTPNYLVYSFLDAFRQLPTSFYRPGAPEKFQEFIDLYGTHMVKSCMMGGVMSMKNTVKTSSELTVDDFKEATQKKFEDVTATSEGKNTQVNSGFTEETRGSASLIIASYARQKAESAQESESKQNITDISDVNATIDQLGNSSIQQDQFQEEYEETYIDARGGDQKLGAAITDLYAPQFKPGFEIVRLELTNQNENSSIEHSRIAIGQFKLSESRISNLDLSTRCAIGSRRCPSTRCRLT